MTINSAIQKSQVLYYTIGKLILSEAQKPAMFRPQLTGRKKKKKKKIEGNTAWPQGHTANSHSKPQKQPEEVPKSLCEYKLWFLSSSKVMLRKRVQNSTERLMITFKVVIAGKMQHLTIADTTVCVSVCQFPALCSTHPQAGAQRLQWNPHF